MSREELPADTARHPQPQRKLIALEEVVCEVMSLATSPVKVDVQPSEATGLVLAEPVVARVNVPPFSNAAMDGYALRSADVGSAPALLDVVAQLPAGFSGSTVIEAGQAARIMTGASMPRGSDAVVMVERTELGIGRSVRVPGPVLAGQHVRLAGDDVEEGSEALPAGAIVGPAALGVLASIGALSVRAFRRPKVGVLSTGDEIVDVGWSRRREPLSAEGHRCEARSSSSGPAPLAPGKIWDSNRPAIIASVAAAGCDPLDLGLVCDDEGEISDRILEGVELCDVVLTTGGASLGDFDWARRVLDRLSGGAMRWVEVAIKPAKPLAFGAVSTKPVLCLPGNPVSSLVSFEMFARPLLRRMAGDPHPDTPVLAGVVQERISRKPDGKLHLVRVALRLGSCGELLVRPVASQGSHHMGAAAAASALALLADGGGLEPGDPVRLLPLAGSTALGGYPKTGTLSARVPAGGR